MLYNRLYRKVWFIGCNTANLIYHELLTSFSYNQFVNVVAFYSQRSNEMQRKSKNIVHLLQDRESASCLNSVARLNLQKIAEEKAASSEMEEIHCKLPSSVRSTFLMSFSPDCSKVASTHGDHKIYICDVKTGKLLHKLEGHPRTPWCLAFHPTSNDILASGCLGGEVRVWDLHGRSERWGAEQNTVITSIAFHPFDKVLVIATFNQIHFWNWALKKPFAVCHTSSIREKIRFVKFNHLGTRLITGILNQHENVPDSTENQIKGPPENRPSSSSGINNRRSLWTRLMYMYQHIDGMEEFARIHDDHSPAMQEEALNRARHYAEAITQANRIQRELTHLWTPSSGTSGSRLDSQTSGSTSSSDTREISESHEEFLVRAFWRTFNRLRTICTALERRMHQLRRNSEPQNTDLPLDPPELPSSLEIPIDPIPGEGSGSRTSYSHATSEYLINILTRLQNSLQFSSLANTVPPEQIQQLQWRISEILERLTNVTGYRARLTTLREHIFEVAERTEHRAEGVSPISRQDLAHCLWLVEMSLQLTRQMQRILQADYRLTRLHLTTTSHLPATSSSRNADQSLNVPRPNQSSTHSCAFCGHRGFTSSSSNEEQQQPLPIDLQYLSRRQRELRDRIRNPVSRLPRSQAMTNARVSLNQRSETENPDTTYTPSSIAWPRVVLTRSNLDSPSAFNASSSRHATTSSVNNFTNSVLGSDSSEDEDNVPTSPRETPNLRPGQFTVNVPRIQLSSQTSNVIPRIMRISSSSSSNETRPSQFYVPEVQIEPSTSSDDHEPLPVQDRPRSPPLPTILSGSSDFSIWQYEPLFSTWHPYFSQAFYEISRRPQFGVHESGSTYFHRIQCWDFSKHDLPVILDAKSNIVVPKCKIHNDASVDISQDGKILVALVPSGIADLLTFAIYSLKAEMLGQCLYKSSYDGNAISVSFSPLNQYVVVGITTPRLSLTNSEKEAVAHIYKLKSISESRWIAINVRSLSQQSTTGNQVSLNSVQWLPLSGHGLIYGTNKGCLCICKPVAPIPSNKPKATKPSRLESDGGFFTSNNFRRRRSDSASSQLMSSTSTQTVEPETQTTGTQTLPGSDRNNSTSSRLY